MKLPATRPVLHQAAFLASLLPVTAAAAVIEEVVEVPVSVKTIYGQETHQSIKVTIFRDDQREKSPFLVLNHGRPASPADFAKIKRARFSAASKYFVSKGFVVLVPTRVGYGDSGGPDVEYSGRCDSRNYPPVYATSAMQTVATLRYAANLPYVDSTKGIVVGQSFGGATAIALASMKIPGLIGAVNFAGGGGGNPVDSPERPCSPYRLASLFEDYGKTSSIPTLWLYSENDRYFGKDLPREWFGKFIKAGGNGKFIQLPPYKEDGHPSFTGNPDAWKPAFEEFLAQIGH